MGAVLRIRDGKKSGSGKNIPDPLHRVSESLVTILEFIVPNPDPDPGSGAYLTPEPGSGMEKFGSEINIPDPRHCLAERQTGKKQNTRTYPAYEPSLFRTQKPGRCLDTSTGQWSL
jgi:hypothetical protein